MDSDMYIYLGERRRVNTEITVDDGSIPVIQGARWSLRACGVQESSGACQIDGTTLFCMVEPRQEGVYCLLIEFQANGESVIKKIWIHVLKGAS